MSAISEIQANLDEAAERVQTDQVKAAEAFEQLKPLVESLDEFGKEAVLYPAMMEMVNSIGQRLQQITEGPLTDILADITTYRESL